MEEGESVEKHLVIVSLPKSGTVFIQRSFEMTLSLFHQRLKSPSNISKKEITEFLRHPISMTGDHLDPTPKNLKLLADAGVTRVTLLVRDPRDAMVSWRHHLQRDDVRCLGTSALGVSDEYYELSEEEQFEEHIENLFPWMQQWLTGWADALDGQWPFAFHLVRFEDFAANPRLAINRTLRFFGYAAEAVLPDPRSPPEIFSAGIYASTHFRRGIVGSHRDELTPRLLRELRRRLDRELFLRYGWPVPAERNSSRRAPKTPSQQAIAAD